MIQVSAHRTKFNETVCIIENEPEEYYILRDGTICVDSVLPRENYAMSVLVLRLSGM